MPTDPARIRLSLPTFSPEEAALIRQAAALREWSLAHLIRVGAVHEALRVVQESTRSTP